MKPVNLTLMQPVAPWRMYWVTQDLPLYSVYWHCLSFFLGDQAAQLFIIVVSFYVFPTRNVFSFFMISFSTCNMRYSLAICAEIPISQSSQASPVFCKYLPTRLFEFVLDLRGPCLNSGTCHFKRAAEMTYVVSGGALKLYSFTQPLKTSGIRDRLRYSYKKITMIVICGPSVRM